MKGLFLEIGLDDSFRVSAAFGQLFFSRRSSHSWMMTLVAMRLIKELGPRGDLMAFVVMIIATFLLLKPSTVNA